MAILKRTLLFLTSALLLLPAAASAAPLPIGGLTQLPGTHGCVSTDGSSQDGSGTCQIGQGISAAESVTVSPDGRFVYVGSYAPYAARAGLAAFSRDPATGQLTQLPGTEGCMTEDGSSQAGPNTCTKVEGIGEGDGRDLAITSDGKWAYMVNQGYDNAPASIVIFQRDPGTGVLTQLPGQAGCISVDGASQDGPGMCQTLATLGIPNGISLSADDHYVYVTDYGSQAVHVLARDSATGGLVEIQCLSEKSAPPTGCVTGGRSLGYAQSLILSPDGTHAYSADGPAGISIFDRDPRTGMLTQKPGVAGCISYSGNDSLGNPTCAIGRVVNGAYAMSIAPDGPSDPPPPTSLPGGHCTSPRTRTTVSPCSMSTPTAPWLSWQTRRDAFRLPAATVMAMRPARSVGRSDIPMESRYHPTARRSTSPRSSPRRAGSRRSR